MDAAEIVSVVIGGITVLSLILVIVLFRSVYIIMPRKEFEQNYVLNNAPAEAEKLEQPEPEEPALI